jgi:6-phosphogluconate dehydrogenase (decarboxylating)
MRVALLGLGVMGAGMAGNLLKHGHALAVYNRSAAKAAPLIAQGTPLKAFDAIRTGVFDNRPQFYKHSNQGMFCRLDICNEETQL